MISIITPHYNDVKGLKRLFEVLKSQTNKNFEWIIVDDLSDTLFLDKLYEFKEFCSNYDFVKLNFSSQKLFAAGARNFGVDKSLSDRIAFIDSDDLITKNFVENRSQFLDFDLVVFSKIKMVTEYEHLQGKFFSEVNSDYLLNFLAANFCWQTSALIFDKAYFIKIGGFDTRLILLEDILISIKSLVSTNKVKIINNNEIDFYYFTKPIDIATRTYCKVSDSVQYLVNQIFKMDSYAIETNIGLLNSYYYLACRYFAKDSINGKNISKHIKLLWFFKSKKLIGFIDFVIALASLLLVVNSKYFLKVNRKLFKKRIEND